MHTKYTNLFGGLSTECFKILDWNRLKLFSTLLVSVLDCASSSNTSYIIDKNVDVCRASNAERLQNLYIRKMMVISESIGSKQVE